ncbi:MAG: prephenate dehydrogenase [Calditrichaeota bacterium]|nr:prephenate dehydrogenase [Calditrichota bacterium]
MDTQQPQFAVIGVGRFGAFWGRELSRFFPVSFYDVDAGRAAQVAPYGRWESLETCLQKDYIFLTIPIRRLEDFLKQHGDAIRAGSVVLDCASVKLAVQEWFTAHLPESVYYAASHPLFGPDSARNSLANHTITLQPGRIPFQQYDLLAELFTHRMGLRVLNISAEEHDRMMAYNLSLIHHLGRTFHKMQIGKLPLIMANLERMNHISRIAANDTEELFQDFYRFNPYAARVRDDFMENFRRVGEIIEPGTLRKRSVKQ